MEIAHSCCPAKRDLCGPLFQLVDVMHLESGTLEEWHCEACGTVIILAPDLVDAENLPA